MNGDKEFIDSFGTKSDVEYQPLTDWKKEPKLTELKELFNDSKSHHADLIAKVEKWEELREAPRKNNGNDRSSVQPKVIRKQAEWRYSAMTEPFLGSDKLFQVNPVTFEDEAAANQNELLLNWQFRTKLNRVKLIDDFVRATVDEGTSFIRVGWNRETKTVTEMVPEFAYYPVDPMMAEEYAEQLQEMFDLSKQNPREYDESIPEELKAAVDYFQETGIPTEVVITGYVEQEVEEILQNKPTVEVISPHNIYFDPTCKADLSDALFIVYVYETSQFQLMRESDRYHNLDQINWNDVAGDGDRESNTIGGFKFKDKIKSKVTAYEYWGYHDINDDGHMVPIVATWIGNTLVRLEESPFPDGKLPFVAVPYLPIKRDICGETDAELLEDNQNIYGALTRGVLDIMGRSANAQTGIPKGFLDVVNSRRFKSGDNYEYNPSMHPSQAVYTHKMADVPASAINMLNMQSAEAESLSGIKAFNGGITGAAYGDVAAGIRGALDATSKREMAILRRLARGMVEIGNKIIAMNSVFLSEKEVVRVSNREFVEIKREDLKGNFDLIVDISTAEIDDNKSQDLAFMVQTVGPIAGPQASMMLIAEIAELKRMPALAERLRNFSFEPSPEEQLMQQLELEKAQLEIAELQSRIQMNLANAEAVSGKANKTNLDTYEQGAGITHKREMAKQKAQSQGNQNLAITKALTDKLKQGEMPGNIEAAIGHAKITELSSPYNEDDLRDNNHSVRPVNNNERL